MLGSKRIGKGVAWFGQSSATPTAIQNGTVWWMQFFLFQVVQYQLQDYRIIELHGAQCKPNQSSALGSSLIQQENCCGEDRIRPFSLTFICRCKIEGSGEMVSIFFTTGKCCSWGWLHVFSVTYSGNPILLRFSQHTGTNVKRKEKKSIKNSSSSTRSYVSGQSSAEGKDDSDCPLPPPLDPLRVYHAVVV